MRCRYLVGCDGGASAVRQALGIAMSGNPVLTYTTNAIFRCPDFLALHGKGEAYRYIVIGPEGTFATIVAINGNDRFRFSIVGDATKRSYDEAEMRALIVRAVGRDFDFEILSILPWIRRELVADRYGSARVFIAGDAAHLTSPTGGFGMNTGIQDVVDLGWKLEAMVAGWGGPKLLASYEIERRPVAVRNVREASGNLSRMLSPREQKPPPEAFAPGPDGRARARRIRAPLRRRRCGANGSRSAFISATATRARPSSCQTARPSRLTRSRPMSRRRGPGHRAPHVWLAPGQSTLDLFGRGFVLLRFAEDAAAEGLRRAAASRGVPLAVADIANEAAARLYERRLVLVRPDGHVAWRADVEPPDPAAIIDTIRGA